MVLTFMASDSSRPSNERRRYTRVRMLPETHTVPGRAEKGGGSNARCHHMKLQTFGPIYGCPVECPTPAVGAELLRSYPGGGAPRPIALSRSVCSSRRNGSRSSAARLETLFSEAGIGSNESSTTEALRKENARLRKALVAPEAREGATGRQRVIRRAGSTPIGAITR